MRRRTPTRRAPGPNRRRRRDPPRGRPWLFEKRKLWWRGLDRRGRRPSEPSQRPRPPERIGAERRRRGASATALPPYGPLGQTGRLGPRFVGSVGQILRSNFGRDATPLARRGALPGHRMLRRTRRPEEPSARTLAEPAGGGPPMAGHVCRSVRVGVPLEDTLRKKQTLSEATRSPRFRSGASSATEKPSVRLLSPPQATRARSGPRRGAKPRAFLRSAREPCFSPGPGPPPWPHGPLCAGRELWRRSALRPWSLAVLKTRFLKSCRGWSGLPMLGTSTPLGMQEETPGRVSLHTVD